MSECHLLRPDWLWLIPLLALLITWLWFRQQRSSHWSKVCDPELLPHILIGREEKRKRWPLVLLTLAGLSAIFALSGPACEQIEQPVFRDQSALVIVLDLSRSMDASDIKPNRLARARLKLTDILRQRKEGLTGLIVYAAQPFMVSPLTDDAHTITAMISSLTSDLPPVQGSRVDLAIQQAVDLMQQAGSLQGDIILITDGVYSNQIDAAVTELRAGNYSLSVLAVGTEDGAPVTLPGGDFLKDDNGAIVIPKIDEAPLRELAQKGNGVYTRLTNNDRDIQTLMQPLIHDELEESKNTLPVTSDQWVEEGPWLLLPLLLLSALAFRRGYLLALVFFITPLPNNAYAMDWSSLWLNKDQQAKQLLDKQKIEEAANQFQDPAWRAAAHYRAGEYQQAIDALQNINSADAYYNQGNAYAQMQQYEQAVAAYDKALEINPNHEDAKYNRALVKAQMRNKEGQSENGDQSQQEDNGEQQQDQGNQSDANKDEESAGQNSSENQQNNDNQTQSQSQNSAEEEKSEQQEESSSLNQGEENKNENQNEQALQQQIEESDDSDERQAEPQKQLLESRENEIATEQWLRRIPDDPGGLLRRKFQYQYQQQQQPKDKDTPPW